MAKRCFTLIVVLCFLVVTSYPAGAHGGGLDRHGCHNETATGGYHCHRGGDDSNTKDALIIIGGVLLALLALKWVLKSHLQIPQASLKDIQDGTLGAKWEWRF